MRNRFAALLIATLAFLLSSAVVQIGRDAAVYGLPEGYPVSLHGGYAKEVNDTVYVDYLQPGSTENYLIKVENLELNQLRYRVEVGNIPSGWMVFLQTGGRSTVVDVDPGSTQAISLYIKNPSKGQGDIMINTTLDGTEQTWPLTLRIICEEGPLKVIAPANSFIVGRMTPCEFDATLTNIGKTPLNITLEMDGMLISEDPIENSWTASFRDRTLVLGPGMFTSVHVIIRCPDTEKLGSQRISSMIATVKGISRPFTSQSLTFKVSVIYDLRSHVTPEDYVRINPGGSVQFTLALTNLAEDTDYVILSVFEKPTNWDVAFNDTVDPTSLALSISKESTREFHPIVYTPINAQAGRHQVVLHGKGTTNLTTIILRVEIARKDLFEISPMLPPYSEGTFKLNIGDNDLDLKLVNKGNFYDTIRLEVESAPTWATLSFRTVRIGNGLTGMDSDGSKLVNISDFSNHLFTMEQDNLQVIEVTFNPGQTAVLRMNARVPLDAPAEKGAMVIRYRYGVLATQKVVQTQLKVVLANVEIMDLDGDSLPNLDVWPEPDYTVGDMIHFSWTLKNLYPYKTNDLEWRIDLSGRTILTGDVGEIQPGESKEFNVSWKASGSTRVRNSARLVITGEAYPIEGQQPKASSSLELYINPGSSGPDWGLMVLFGGFMMFLMVLLVAAWFFVQSKLKQREAEERVKYEAVYGPMHRERLGEKRAPSKIGGSTRRSLPSGRAERAPPIKAPPMTRGRKGAVAPKKKETSPPSRPKEGPPRSAQEGEGASDEVGGMEELSELEE